MYTCVCTQDCKAYLLFISRATAHTNLVVVHMHSRSHDHTCTHTHTLSSLIHTHTHTHTQVLPFPKEAVSQLDYNSRLRLALCFFRLKTMVEGRGEMAGGGTTEAQQGLATDSGKQIVKKRFASDMKPALFQPGMLQDLMSEVCLCSCTCVCVCVCVCVWHYVNDLRLFDITCTHIVLPILSLPHSIPSSFLSLQALDGFLMVTQVDGTIVFLSESIHKHMGLFQVNN